MKCPNCDKKITNERIKSVGRRYSSRRKAERINHNIYCNHDCMLAYKSKKAIKAKRCKECGEVKDYRIHTNIYGVQRCQDCKEIAVSNRRTDSEIKALVMLNPGAGFDYFIDKVFSAPGRKMGKSTLRWRLTEFLKEIGEYEGIDYIGWLQTDSTMRFFAQDNIPAGFEKYAKGQRRSIPAGHLRRTRMRQGFTLRETYPSNIKIPPEFRWGEYKPL